MKINNLLCLVLSFQDSLAGFRLVYMAVAHENAAFFYYDGKHEISPDTEPVSRMWT